MGFSYSVIESSRAKVVIRVEDFTASLGPVSIAWADLAPLFAVPDPTDGTGAVTGLRPAAKTDLRLKSITSSHNHTSTRTANLQWAGGTPSELWPIPHNAMDIDFPAGGLKFDGGTPDATNAVTVDASSGNMTTTKGWVILLVFGI